MPMASLSSNQQHVLTGLNVFATAMSFVGSVRPSTARRAPLASGARAAAPQRRASRRPPRRPAS